MKMSKEEIKELRKKYGGGKKLPAEFVIEIVKRRGGTLNEDFKYIGSKNKFEVKCNKGHIWSTCWSFIQSGNWCPKCSTEFVKNSLRLDENIVREFVTSKKGVLYKDFKYINAFERFWVTCEKGHRFETFWNNLQGQNSWCPECARERVGAVLRLDESCVRGHIEVKGGSLDEDFEYKGAFSKFFVTCREGHRFETFWNHLQSQDSWCPECSGNIVHVEDVLKLITSKGGTVGTDFFYVNNRVKFWITCSKGHKWETNWDVIKQGCWCPYCLWKTQEEFRTTIEKFFDKLFPSVWPGWLRYLHGRCLQLDGYNEELLMAFEYQGYQHYKPSHFYKYDEGKFKDLLKRDNFKKVACINLGISLIVVPCFVPKENWVTLIENSINGRNVV